jgi:DNA (cytosine-5)-methyltransferase 1
MSKPRLLDLFCGAGGCSVGYHRAGFEVIGVDHKPQKNYPFEFHQADAMSYPLDGFDIIHASPPCQRYSVVSNIYNGKPYQKEHPDLVNATRERLRATGLPYVIENVPNSPLVNYLMLCGTMFKGLRVYRHRHFETWPMVMLPPMCCNHKFKMAPSRSNYHTLEKYEFITCVGHNFSVKSGRIAMGIDWMTRNEIAQAIPPAYTEYIGRQLMAHYNKSLVCRPKKRDGTANSLEIFDECENE